MPKLWPLRQPTALHPDQFLERSKVPGLPRTFALGCFARYQTLYSQQVRAINLVESLSRTDLLVDGARVLVVGGGIAGLTAAVAARMRGARVTIIEAHDKLIPYQRASTKRYLHPYAYDWPFVDRRDTVPLPLMAWRENISSVVFSELETAFRDASRRLGGIDVKLGHHLESVEDSVERSIVRVTLTGSATAMEGDILVLALGFGRELRFPDMPGYWDGDGLASVGDKPLNWLVSGGGDGALTDLIRLLVQDFNHEMLVQRLLQDVSLTEGLATHIRSSATMREAFGKVDQSHRDALLNGLEWRRDTAVKLCTSRAKYLESQDSCILNRFLVYLLEDRFEFQPGHLRDIPDLQRAAAHPYRVAFVRSPDDDSGSVLSDGAFHGVIPRHGVDACKVDDERIPKVWAESAGLRDIWRRCKEARESGRAGSKFDDRSRVRIFRDDDFVEGVRARPQGLPADGQSGHLRVLAVTSSSPVPPGARALADVVPDALDSFEKKVKQALQLGRDDTLRSSFAVVATDSAALWRGWLEHAVRQLCRADVVFFDITEYQPLVMMLLGIRSAARLGVNILCTYDERSSSFWSHLPFNIKEMHPLGIGPRESDTLSQVGKMLLDALGKQKGLLEYQDLPGFHALRRGALSDRFRRPIHWDEEILWLCSFDDAYTNETNAQTIRDKIRVVFGDQVQLRRLTEILSPELVSQKLFDAIRRYKLCIVDWTLWSSNVFFEFGVRLAANPRAPVCLISESPAPSWSRMAGDVADVPNATKRDERHRSQIDWLEGAFAAIRYRIGEAFDLSEIKDRVERMDSAEQGDIGAAPITHGKFRYDFVYSTIAKEISADLQGLRSPIELLKGAAAGLVGEAGKRRLDIATLYADRNQELNEQSRRVALDYDVAAWRYAHAEMRGNPGSDDWKSEENRLANRIRGILELWPGDDARKSQLLRELDGQNDGANR